MPEIGKIKLTKLQGRDIQIMYNNVRDHGRVNPTEKTGKGLSVSYIHIAMMEEENNYIILDVRTPEEFSDKHIPDAINIPNETIGTAEIPELPDKAQLILVYCRSGNRSKQASDKLANLGYTNIVEFGGINDWPGETVSDGE